MTDVNGQSSLIESERLEILSTTESPDRQINYETIATGETEMAQARASRKLFRWVQSSKEELEFAETELVKYLKLSFTLRDVDCGEFPEPSKNCCRKTEVKKTRVLVRTLSVNEDMEGTPLVFLHGLGIGLGYFLPLINLLNIAGTTNPLYAIDIPGFGRSTKFRFAKDVQTVEDTFTDMLLNWTKNLKLPPFVMAGHSFGGYVSSIFALKHPEKVRHLILLDGWGLAPKPERLDSIVGVSNRCGIICLSALSRVINPLALFRLAGPFGPKRIGEDSIPKIKMMEEKCGIQGFLEAFTNYLFHCVASRPCSGEAAYRSLMTDVVYAKNPICYRLNSRTPPLTVLLPPDNFLPKVSAEELQMFSPEAIKGKIVVQEILSADHENLPFCTETSEVICKVLSDCDNQLLTKL